MTVPVTTPGASTSGKATLAHPTHRPRELRSRRGVWSIRWIVTAAAVLLTTGGDLSVGNVAERNPRRELAPRGRTRLLPESRDIALTNSEALLTQFPGLSLRPVLKEM